MEHAPSWAEARRRILARVDPIVRLEALPPHMVEGRVLAEDLVQTGCLPYLGRGQTLGADQMGLFHCLGSDEVLVYSQPKVLILEGDCDDDPSAPSLGFLADRISSYGGVPMLERGEDRLDMVQRNVGADLMITRHGPWAAKLCPGIDKMVLKGIAMTPGGGTSLTILGDTPLIILPQEGPDLLASILLPLQALVRQVSRKDDAMPRHAILGADLIASNDVDTVYVLSRDRVGRLVPYQSLEKGEGPWGYILVPAGSGGLKPDQRVAFWPI